MPTIKEVYLSYKIELESLSKEFNEFIKSKDYVYSDEYEKYCTRYNSIINKYYKSTGIPIQKIELYDFDYSSTKKTMRDVALIKYEKMLEGFIRLVDTRYREEKEKEEQGNKQVKLYEMRKCLKTGVIGCPKNPVIRKGQVFVGMPFSNEYLNDYEYGIKLTLEQLGKKVCRIDEKIGNIDIMCKICKAMQESESLIFMISGTNPNVMFELGLSYGLGKKTIILKDSKTKPISDISGVEYIEYEHAFDIQKKLSSYFSE